MREQVEYKLIQLGLRLRDVGSPCFTWRDLHVVVKQSADWNIQEQLLAHAASSLQWLVWAKTKDGSKNKNRPKAILPPQLRAQEDRAKGIMLSPAAYRQRIKGKWSAPTEKQKAALSRMLAGKS